jgi:hypothetical protein
VKGKADGRISISCEEYYNDTFFDAGCSIFENNIQWMADDGITRGHNPLANTRYCPAQPVDRGAMAAFLHRGMGN